MENLTLNDISTIILFIVGLIGGISYLHNSLKTLLTKLLDEQFKVVNKKLDDNTEAIRKVDIQTCKNFLVRYLADVEREGVIYDSEKKRFWEEYDHYINDLGENSYIKEWVARLKEAGKL